jgi:hypothetical protein
MDFLEKEIATQQEQIHNAYIRIKELNEELNALKRKMPNGSCYQYQMEFDFYANI